MKRELALTVHLHLHPLKLSVELPLLLQVVERRTKELCRRPS